VNLLESQEAFGICCDVEKDVTYTQIIFVGFFAAVEVGALDFQAQIGLQIYAAAFDAIAVGVEKAVVWASGNALQDVVASLGVLRCGETAGGFCAIDVGEESVEGFDGGVFVGAGRGAEDPAFRGR